LHSFIGLPPNRGFTLPRRFAPRAALSLARPYQSVGRQTDAHDVLGPALQGFSPTPEFPQVREALELVATIKARAQS
jgi:hypothetical protein